jgi:hypothetical protein
MSKLHPLEHTEVGDVSGKKLLHLQYHFGLDTLSLRQKRRLSAFSFGSHFY